MIHICGLYYKHITIVNDDSSIINWWHLSLTYDARVVFYDINMFIIQATADLAFEKVDLAAVDIFVVDIFAISVSK